MGPLTITKQESARDDRFYLLESLISCRQTYIHTDGEVYIACPVKQREVDKKTWGSSAAAHERWMRFGMLNVLHRIVHGRRINDEVELFEMEDGKETEGIREEMEALGLTVRSYIPEPTKKKFPSYKLLAKKEKTHLDRCIDSLMHAIAVREIETNRPTPYALLANAGIDKTTRKKRVLIAIFQEAQFRQFFEFGHEDFNSNGCSYRVFGAYHDDKVHWHCDDDEFLSFFSKPDGYVEVKWWDDAALIEADQREAERRAKKQAKKLRRQQMAFSGQGNAYGALEDEDGDGDDAEVKAQAKKQKEKAKRKTHQARKKAREAAESLIVPPSDGHESGSNKQYITVTTLKPRRKTLINTGERWTEHNPKQDDSTKATPRVFGGEASDLPASKKKDPLGNESSSSSSSGDSDGSEPHGGGLEVITMGDGATAADIMELMRNLKGPVALGYRHEEGRNEAT